MAAMRSLFLCAVVALAIHQASAVVINKEWKVPTTLSDTVAVGDTVIWTWADTAPHDIQFLTFPTGFTGIATNGVVGLTVPPTPIRAPYNVTFTPTLPGTYTYVCTVHASMTGTLIVAGDAANTTTPAANTTTIASNTTAIVAAANATTNATANATAIEAVIVARTLGFATAAITQNATAVVTYITSDFSVFAANTSGPLTIPGNTSAILGYLTQNLALATAANPAANATAPVVKQFILIDPTNALITVQVPILQHFATLLWTYLSNTTYSTTPNWYAKTGVFTPAPISLA
jgi:plastocyanin